MSAAVARSTRRGAGIPAPRRLRYLPAEAGKGPGLPERNTYYIVTAMLMMSIVVVYLVVFRG